MCKKKCQDIEIKKFRKKVRIPYRYLGLFFINILTQQIDAY